MRKEPIDTITLCFILCVLSRIIYRFNKQTFVLLDRSSRDKVTLDN